MFQFWILPEIKEKGSHDKWIEQEPITAKNRKSAVEQVKSKYKLGCWKLRKV